LAKEGSAGRFVMPKFVIYSAYTNPTFKNYLMSNGIKNIYEKPVDLKTVQEILLKKESEE
jgi:hypothetical protein